MEAHKANIFAAVDPDVKAKAEKILSGLGTTVSAAINMFYEQIIAKQGIPFSVKNNSYYLPDINKLSQEEIDKEIEKGLKDIEEGKTRPAAQVFSDLRNKYGRKGIRQHGY
jgi:addiction module RelB/DinJ family antitoxin